jgi:CheY-like chemotaxis protein
MSAAGEGPGATARVVLVAEDEYFVAQDLAMGLADLGLHVLGPYATVRDTLAAIETAERLDGAILDINLSGERCFPVADALRCRGVRFVFTTGYDARSLPAAYGDVVRCEKPVAAEKVAAALFR